MSTKWYRIQNCEVIKFVDVEMRAGVLYGKDFASGKYAWLDDNGIQFEGERRQYAVRVIPATEPRYSYFAKC